MAEAEKKHPQKEVQKAKLELTISPENREPDSMSEVSDRELTPMDRRNILAAAAERRFKEKEEWKQKRRKNTAKRKN